MKTQQCADCDYFQPTNWFQHGYCHRDAPVRREIYERHDGRGDSGEATAAWPGVDSRSWCGEFQERKKDET